MSETCEHIIIDWMCRSCLLGRIETCERELAEQSRLLGQSGSNEARLLARVAELEKERVGWKRSVDYANEKAAALVEASSRVERYLSTQYSQKGLSEQSVDMWQKLKAALSGGGVVKGGE